MNDLILETIAEELGAETSCFREINKEFFVTNKKIYEIMEVIQKNGFNEYSFDMNSVSINYSNKTIKFYSKTTQ